MNYQKKNENKSQISQLLNVFSFSLATYRECSDHQRAIDIWKEETLRVYKEQLGDHPWTASVLQYMAGSYKALVDGTSGLGNVELAVRYCREALQLRIYLLGAHQDTARSHVDLSDLLVITKEFKEALDELEKALEIQRDVLGEKHGSTMNTLAKKMEILPIIMRESDQLESDRAFKHGMRHYNNIINERFFTC